MSTRKRLDPFDVEQSGSDAESDDGYDSEAAEESKGRAVKRRKTEESDEEFESEGGEETGDDNVDQQSHDEGDEEGSDNHDGQNGTQSQEENSGDESTTKKKTTVTRPLDKVKAKPSKENKTGVIYLSSLPPYLKPFALKKMLEQRGFGPITRVFLTPAVTGKRSSNRRKMYTDGWVEFASKKTAKICAETLNANIVGGKKSGWYHDDVWNMKYLKGFKWSDLMEQVQRERSEREAKRRIEDARARKQDKVFLQGVEKGKIIEGIKKKKEEKERRKRGESSTGMDDDGGGGSGGEEMIEKPRRVFKQNQVRHHGQKDLDDLGEDTKRVLGKIF
ncbi:hypothetical protein VTN31DRAFT_6592 [Thermomyces dupontii]|uniref:uncharacterized protein n=1 Tax=Talaromyces thermophilus TaxID=28565 RepID=UPI003744427E